MSEYLTRQAKSDPSVILELRDRQYAAELIATALLHFDIFSWLSDHDDVAVEELSACFGFVDRPLDVLLTLCRSYGFIEGVETVRLTILGREHLVKNSPWFLGPYYVPIRDAPIARTFREVLTLGKPGSWQAKDGGEDWHDSMRDPDFAREFIQLMNCRGLQFGQRLADEITPYLGDRIQLLDVGGGSGIYSATLCAAHEQLRATVLEQEPVDEIVRSEIARHGMEEKISVISGDMFSMVWPSVEIVLFSNVLHDWGVREVNDLLKKASACLKLGGLLVIHDAFVDDAKCGPVEVAEYSALLMSITQGKCYSAAEYGELMKPFGFELKKYHATVAGRGFLTAIKK